ncbi:MAG: T9SS type A sorting domain-containing protein [Bacteroidetes bacterium]|nr:T9SS type A sorting domain-containing protein [Bacteroidota bacterium]
MSTPLANITAAEYFFDTDPGFGQATPITVTAGQDINFSFTGAITSLSNGVHRLYVRSKDANGKWSISATQLFYKEALLSHTPGNITSAEYFFDTDPGVGLATNIPLTSGADVTIAFNPLIVSLSTSSFHKLYIRSRDANGNWSIKSVQSFFIPASLPPVPVRLTKLEYFIDSDPGFGAGIDVPITRALDLTINFTASISSLSSGLHSLSVRSQDSLGRWSMAAKQLFYREAVSSHVPGNITAAEYFIDNDPGVGMATAVSVVAGQDITFSVTAGICGLSYGLHRFFLRSKDADGKWSLSAPQIFYKEPSVSTPLANIVKAEYFIDNDPGFGLATSVSVTAGQDINIPISAAISSLSTGIHRFVFRSQDANGKWSLSTPQIFYKEPVVSTPLANIIKAEYFIDTDPGFGLATSVSVTAGQDINIPITASISSLSTGVHRFIFRSQDANGKWSHSTPKFFYNEAILTHTPGYLTRLEWFWDTDPGFGSGTSVTFPSSTMDLQNQTFTAPIPSTFKTNQKHYLFVRSKDDWSLTSFILVDFTGIPLPVTLLSFRAQRQANQVKLNWTVENERDMLQYVVERSSNARDFDSIGQVTAQGLKSYQLYDTHPVTGMNYYRLRQVEISGKVEYSATVSVLFSSATEVMDLYPNPASEYFNISTKMPLAGVALYDLNGKLVRRFDDLSGTYSLSGLAAGAYIVHALGEDGQVLVKPLVVK